jgi:membrane-associated phospholipid phosphatase
LLSSPLAYAQQPVPDPVSDRQQTAPTTFANLLNQTVIDFRNLPSRDAFTWLGAGAAAAFVGHFQDRSITEHLSASSDLGDILEPGRIVGGVPLQMGAALAAFAIGRASNHPGATAVGADLFRAQALSQGLTFAGKLTARRSRPDQGRFSFPSGHTAISFASATVLQRDLGWKAGIPAYAVAAYVAASRVQAKRHYLSDVAFGAMIGIAAGRSVTVGRGDARFAVSPIAAPGGAGVSFSLVTGSRP